MIEANGPEKRAKEDELLVIRCQLGERSAFDELTERWHLPLWQYVRRQAGEDDAAKDVAQDVWLRVLRGIDHLRDGSRLRPWLFGIARRALMDRLRHQYAGPVASDIDVADLAADQAVDSLEKEILAMEHELARLPATEREVLTLFYLRELSLAEVARGARCAGRYRQVAAVSRPPTAAAWIGFGRETSMTSTHTSPPPADLRRLVDRELSGPSRIGYVALLFASLTMTIVIASLWLTEAVLPARTRVAFAVTTVIGLSWTAFAGWVLTTRRPLFGRDSVVAGRMAVSFTTTFVIGALTLGYLRGGTAPYAAAAMGLGLLAGAIALLVRARRRVARLTTRREELEHELGRNPR